MRALVAAARTALALGLAACGGGSPSGDDAAPASTAGAAGATASSDGAQVAASQGCQACHKLPSGGADGPGPSLVAEGTVLDASQIEAKLIQGPDQMPSYASLKADEPQDFAALVGYIASLKG